MINIWLFNKIMLLRLVPRRCRLHRVSTRPRQYAAFLGNAFEYAGQNRGFVDIAKDWCSPKLIQYAPARFTLNLILLWC
jgi:hypothetical protein